MDPEIAEQARAALKRHVVEPLVARCVDAEYGGFLVDFDERWRPVGPHDKTLEHASRTTLAFALVDRAMPGAGCDRLVRHGCAFLQNVMWDAAHGGFFARVDRSGSPRSDGLKHPHAVTYAALAFLLSEPCLPPGEGRLWACRSQQWLDDVAWDPEHGGYWGSYRRDNQRYPDGASLPTADGLDTLSLTPGFKESNTLGDAIDTLTVLVAHGVGGQCADRLAWLVDLVVHRLTDCSGAFRFLYQRDWRPADDIARLGQQLQMVHRLLAVAAVLDESDAVARSRDLAEFALAFGRHPAGGFCFSVNAGDHPTVSADRREWWVQLEAAHALHALATHQAIDRGGRVRYAQARDQQWAFLREYFFDERFGGIRECPAEPDSGWRARLAHWLRGGPGQEPLLLKTHGWKDPFHEVVTFLALAEGEVLKIDRSA
jgi:mannose/cellobiose epimerase-like protein (N-acyl-D-glucosamine 2-epimerase family)